MPLGKGQLVALEGRIQTRQWEDDHKIRHWKTEVVASSVEMLSGRRKKDYALESAADSLAAQADPRSESLAARGTPDTLLPLSVRRRDDPPFFLTSQARPKHDHSGRRSDNQRVC